MLSYRHSYHAGNFADVLKHCVLIHSLNYLKNKEKPFAYIDTHAGAGNYSLHSEQSEKNQEYQQGIAKLWQSNDAPNELTAYLNIIKAFNPTEKLDYYPGSPMIAGHLLRSQDRMFLYELHRTEVGILRTAMKKEKRAQLFQQNGFTDSLRLLPPQQRRGFILIDPSYEIKTEYQQVIKTLTTMYQRFATGTYALWYPVVERARIEKMETTIQASNLRNVQLFELGQKQDNSIHGMTASGMIVINPPWTLQAEMEILLPYLSKKLAVDQQGYYRIKQLNSE